MREFSYFCKGTTISLLETKQRPSRGQCFRLNRSGAGNISQVTALEKVLKIQQTSEFTHRFHCSSEDYRNISGNSFELKGDCGEIKKFV
jgi:hypothetical protein